MKLRSCFWIAIALVLAALPAQALTTGVVIAQGPGKLVDSLIAAGAGSGNLYDVLLQLMSNSTPTVAGVISPLFLAALGSNCGTTPVYTTSLSAYAASGVLIGSDCTVKATNMVPSGFNGLPGTSALLTAFPFISAPAALVSSTSSAPILVAGSSDLQGIACSYSGQTGCIGITGILYAPSGPSQSFVISNEGGHLIANLLAGGYGGENLWHALLDLQILSNPSLSGVITPAFLNHFGNCAAGSQIFATKLSGYTGTIAIGEDCSVTSATVQGSAFNGKPGTTSLITSISGGGSATAVSSTTSAPLTSWTENVAVGSGTATVTYDAFAILYTPGSAPQISLAGIGNAANYVAGKVSPGEINVVYGEDFGPSTLAQLQFVDGVATTTLGNTRIYFDGVAAPMVYATAGPPSVLSCVVPYAVNSSTQVQVEYNGVKGNTVTVPVVASVPAIFILNQSGTGQGAILNWPDYSVNGAANRVAAGGYVMAYGTGEGRTDIATDGEQVPLAGPYPKPLLTPWTATVGGQPASVTYAGSAPGFVAGLFQVNVQIPTGLTTGIYDLVIKTGTFSSTAGLTVAVK